MRRFPFPQVLTSPTFVGRTQGGALRASLGRDYWRLPDDHAELFLDVRPPAHLPTVRDSPSRADVLRGVSNRPGADVNAEATQPHLLDRPRGAPSRSIRLTESEPRHLRLPVICPAGGVRNRAV